jgi:outer membrane protein assembly factor BamB
MGARYSIRLFQRRPVTYLLLLVGCILTLAFSAVGVSYFTGQAAHAAPPDWTTFLGSNAHTGYDAAETTINEATAPNLKVHWTFLNPRKARITTEVIVANGMLYWGSWDGILHASDPNTGLDIWTKNLGTQLGGCSHQQKGVISSVTVATVPINGTPTSVVFVGAGASNLYALDAHTGTVLWQTNLDSNPASFLYSSTDIYNGSIYIGIASTGDCPLVQSSVVQVNASTGLIQNTFNIVPNGCLGGAVWGTPTIDETTGMIYFGTGNAGTKSCTQPLPLGQALVELNATDLSFVAAWQVPASDTVGKDDDFGSSPTLFNATINGVSRAMIGIVNKDGDYYAFDRTNISTGPLWKNKISVGGAAPAKNASIPAAAYDGTALYAAGSLTTIGGQQCAGSLQKLDPATGTVLWADCLSASVLAPTLAVPGLVIVGSGNNMDVVDSSTGNILYTYQDISTLHADFWGAATVSGGILYETSASGTLFAFGL